MYTELEYIKRFEESCAQANKDGWRTFSDNIFNSLEATNQGLHDMIVVIIGQAGFKEGDVPIVREGLALIIRTIWPIPSVKKEVIDHIQEAFLTLPNKRKREVVMSQGICCLEDEKLKRMYEVYKNFLSEVCGEDNNLLHSILAIVYVLVAAPLLEIVVDESAAHIHDQIASIPGIKM